MGAEAGRVANKAKILGEAGFDQVAYEDFVETTIDLIKKLPFMTVHDLEKAMNVPETSNSVVVFFRLLSSAWIRTHPDDFAAFLETDVPEYCSGQVEAFGKEADEITLASLVAAIGVQTAVWYCDSNEGNANMYKFEPKKQETDLEGVQVNLLYLVGHYELLHT